MPKPPKRLTPQPLSDAELITACLDVSGLTQEQFCAQVLHGLRTPDAIRKWRRGDHEIPGAVRAYLERYLAEQRQRDAR